MRRDTKRIEQLLRGTQANRKLVREEIAAGATLQHVYDELLVHEQIFSSRLTEIRDWNKTEEAAAADKAAADKAAADKAAADKAAADKAAADKAAADKAAAK